MKLADRLTTLEADIRYIKKAVQILALVLFGHVGITAIPLGMAMLP